MVTGSYQDGDLFILGSVCYHDLTILRYGDEVLEFATGF